MSESDDEEIVTKTEKKVEAAGKRGKPENVVAKVKKPAEVAKPKAAEKPVATKKVEEKKKAPAKPVEPAKEEEELEEAEEEEAKPVVKAKEVPKKKEAPAAAKAKPVPAKKKESEESDLSPESEPEVKPAPAKPKVVAKKAEPAKKPKEEEAEMEDVKEAEPEKEEEVVEEEKNEPVVEAKPVEAAEGASEDVEIFIGNLPYSATDEQISEFFSSYGKVAAVRLIQREGRPAGKGFVTFETHADAAKAKEANGTEFLGRAIEIRYSSDPIPERQSYGGQSQGYGSAPKPGGNGNTIFVGGLSYNSTKESVQAFFSQCGNINAVRVATDLEGNPRGFAHVEFDSEEAVKAAVGLSGSDLDGRNIRIDVAGAKGEKPAGGRGGFSGGRGGFSGGRGGFRGGDRGGFSGGRGGFRGGDRGGFSGGRGGFRGGRGFGGASSSINAARGKGTIQDFQGKKMKLE